jgi:hypothetical protein
MTMGATETGLHDLELMRVRVAAARVRPIVKLLYVPDVA